MNNTTIPNLSILNNFRIWWIPALILTSYIYLAIQPDLRLAIPEMIGATALVTILLTLACTEGVHGRVLWSPGHILLLAFIFRLFFLFRPPELSDDIFRYLWDGLHTLQGVNPYAAAPEQVLTSSQPLRELASRVNHPSLITIYPPAAQYVFAVGAALGGKILGLKGLLVALDLVSCLFILRLLKACEKPLVWGVLYAWHPLPILEIAGSGHIDGAGIFFLTLALTFLLAPPKWLANKVDLKSLIVGTSFAAAILTKLFPLVFLPAALLPVRNRFRAGIVIGLFVAGGLFCVPFWPELGNAIGTLQTYARHWEFSGFVFQTLSGFMPSGQITRILLAISFCSVCVWIWKSALHHAPLPMNILRACYAVAFIYLLLTPTLHPWYALYLVCLLPFSGEPAGIVLSWSVLLSYQVLIPYTILHLWQESMATSSLIALAPVSAVLLSIAVGRAKRHRSAGTSSSSCPVDRF